MVNFTTFLCTIVLCLSFNYGSTVVNFRLPKTQNCNSNPKRDSVMAARLNLIKSMTLEVWKQNNGLPYEFNYQKSEKGYTVVQMLSSLWVMGLKGEFELSKKWLEASFDGIDHMEFTFLASTEYLGSMLSCFALTNDTTWLNKAIKAGQRLKLEFDTPTGLPNRFVKSKRRLSFKNDINLTEAGGEHLEFTYLADMINDLDMKTKIRTARTFLQYVKKPHNGLYGDYIDVNTGEWSSSSTDFDFRIYWHSNPFYPYLVNSFVQSNGRDEQAIEMYREAIDAMVNNLVIQTSARNNLTYVVPSRNKVSTNMDYNSCHFGAMLALGAEAMQRKLDCNSSQTTNLIRQHWTLAKAITETCHLGANRTESKLPSDDGQKSTFWTTAAYAESYFVLWRLTHDIKYRDYAWEMTRAIYKRNRCVDGKYFHQPNIHHGYCSFDSNYRYTHAPKLHHLSTTLKYLYLTFTDDSVLPLDQWVFNRVGQPLPVCGNNAAYPADKCNVCNSK